MRKDWRNAYRAIPISPFDFELCGFKYKDMYFVDCFLGSSAPAIFCRYSDQLEWILKFVYNVPFTTHYFDDHLFVAPKPGLGPPE